MPPSSRRRAARRARCCASSTPWPPTSRRSSPTSRSARWPTSTPASRRKITKPRPNVVVRLCSIECSFSKPLADERNKAFRDDINGWSKICKRLYIWDYTTNFRHYILPHPNLRVLGPNVRFFADHNVKGIFEQGAYTTNGAEMAELRAWVLAKLLWDPTLDGEALIDEFLAGYYGPAAPHIKAYLKSRTTPSRPAATGSGCFEETKAKFLSFDTLARGWKHLQAAEQAVADDPDLRFRVQVAQLPAMYTFMMRWKRPARGRKDRRRRVAHAGLDPGDLRPVHDRREKEERHPAQRVAGRLRQPGEGPGREQVTRFVVSPVRRYLLRSLWTREKITPYGVTTERDGRIP